MYENKAFYSFHKFFTELLKKFGKMQNFFLFENIEKKDKFLNYLQYIQNFINFEYENILNETRLLLKKKKRISKHKITDAIKNEESIINNEAQNEKEVRIFIIITIII